MDGGCEMHHIDAVSEGGQHELDNLILLCPNCHKLAHNGILTKDQLRGLAQYAAAQRPDLEEIRKIVDGKLRVVAVGVY